MELTLLDLRTRGITPTFGANPTAYRPTREAVVKEALTTLLRRDYPTQDLSGRYIDKRFEVLTIDVNPQDFRAQTEYRDLQFNTLGWSMTKKIRVDNRLDEVCALLGLSGSLGSVQNGPTDLTMNSFRFYDVLRLMMGEEFDLKRTFEVTEDTDAFTRYVRFRYFKFIALHLKEFVRHVSYDDLLTSLYLMQVYQVLPCLIAAFRIKERNDDIHTNILNYPILEQKDWTEFALDDLLLKVRVRDTMEWVKLSPLFRDEDFTLNSTLESATIPMPMEDTPIGEPDRLRMMKYLGLAPMWNFSFLNYKGHWFKNWFDQLTSMGELASQESYITSYNISVKGYYLSEANYAEGDNLLTFYDEVVNPDTWTYVRTSLEDQDPVNTLTPEADTQKVKRSFDSFNEVLEDAKGDIFSPVMDYSSRRAMLASSLKTSGNMIPLFYSFVGGQISYKSSSED
jgi:hypothetical protein